MLWGKYFFNTNVAFIDFNYFHIAGPKWIISAVLIFCFDKENKICKIVKIKWLALLNVNSEDIMKYCQC